MPIIGTDKDENDPNGAAGTPGTGGAAPKVSPGAGGAYIGGGSGQGATTTAAPAAAAAPTSSGSFTNLGSYLNANQGGGAQMGKAVSGMIDTTGQATEKARGAYQGEGAMDAAAGTKQVDPNALAGITKGYDPGTGTYSGPLAPAAHDYSGPQDVSSLSGKAGADRTSYKALADTLSGANGKGGLLANANGGMSGVGALEKGMFQQPSYTQGENNLDAFLTGGSSDYQQSLKDMNAKWGGEPDKGAAADKAVSDTIAAGKKTSQATQRTYLDAIKGQQDKAAAWRPSVDSGMVPVMGTTSSDFKPGSPQAPNAPGGPGGPSLPSQAGPYQGVVDALNGVTQQVNNGVNSQVTGLANGVKSGADAAGLGVGADPAINSGTNLVTGVNNDATSVATTGNQATGSSVNKINSTIAKAKKPKWA